MELSEKKALTFITAILVTYFLYQIVNKNSNQRPDSSFENLIVDRVKELNDYKKKLRNPEVVPFNNEYESLQNGNLYANYFFKLSLDLPDSWNIDRGVSESTLIRAFRADSGLTMALSADLVRSEENYYFMNNLFNGDEATLKKLRKDFPKFLKLDNNIEPLDLEIYKTKIGVNTFIVCSFKNIQYFENHNYTHKTTIYQAFKSKIIYTIAYSAPELFFDSVVVKSAVNRFTISNPEF
jgi:hypothetical protein